MYVHLKPISDQGFFFFFDRISDQVLLLRNAQFFRFLKFGNAHNFSFMVLLLQVLDSY